MEVKWKLNEEGTVEEMRILHLSDIHFRREYENPEAGDEYGGMVFRMQNPLVFLDSCLKTAMDNQPAPDLVVISGDLTEDGDEGDYRYLKRFIRKRIGKAPLVVTLGNHDNKRAFRVGWLEDEGRGNEPYHALEWVGDTAIISFDSSVQGVSDGRIDEERLSWLSDALNKTAGSQVILLTHHHLLPEQGQIPPLPDSGRLIQLIRFSGACLILCGHTHHHYAGMVADKPCYIADGISFSGENMGEGLVRFEEKYGYCIYELEAGAIKRCKSETFYSGRFLGTLRF